MRVLPAALRFLGGTATSSVPVANVGGSDTWENVHEFRGLSTNAQHSYATCLHCDFSIAKYVGLLLL